MTADTSAAAPGPSFWRDITLTHVANAVVGFLFAASGPLAIILATGSRGGLSEAEIASWVFGSLAINGALSIGFCLVWRQPLVFFWTIPGTVLIGPALGHLSFPEIVGAYIATGLLMLALGALGLVRRAMALVPMPIVMGMVAGVFLQFGLDWVRAFQADFVIAAAMTAFPPGERRPAAGGAPAADARRAGCGRGGDLVFRHLRARGRATGVLAAPALQVPQFSWAALAELVVPLAITVLVVQNGQGIAVLTAAGHAPPVDAIAVGCGVSSIVSAFVGAVSTCLTGPVNAIIASGGERRTQYTAGVVVGLLAILFGLFAPLVTRLMLAAPPAFIATLAGSPCCACCSRRSPSPSRAASRWGRW